MTFFDEETFWLVFFYSSKSWCGKKLLFLPFQILPKEKKLLYSIGLKLGKEITAMHFKSSKTWQLSLIHLLIQIQQVGFLNSFLEDCLVGNLWPFFYFWIALHTGSRQLWYPISRATMQKYKVAVHRSILVSKPNLQNGYAVWGKDFRCCAPSDL